MAGISPDELRARFAEAGHPDIAEELIAGSKPAIAIIREPKPDEEIAVGASKLGGLPDLPAGVPWPERDGKPLAFLAQIDLADVPACEGDPSLPREGLLSFFYDNIAQPWGFDPADRGSAVVQYSRGVGDLRRVAAPKGAFGDDAEYDQPFQSCGVRFEITTSYPEPAASVYELEDAEEVLELLSETVKRGQGEDEAPYHQLLGLPMVIQNAMEEECQLASNGIYCGDELSKADRKKAKSLLGGVKDWMLVMQLDSDGIPGWMWGDMGILYFWIRKQDLAAGDFAKTWFVLQCC